VGVQTAFGLGPVGYVLADELPQHFDLPVPVEPQMHRCVDRISGVISSGTPFPSTKPSLSLFPKPERFR
jgi:hypothetical protein